MEARRMRLQSVAPPAWKIPVQKHKAQPFVLLLAGSTLAPDAGQLPAGMPGAVTLDGSLDAVEIRYSALARLPNNLTPRASGPENTPMRHQSP